MTAVEIQSYPVEIRDGDDALGVSNVVGALLAQNFAEHPERAKTARTFVRPIAIVSTDTETACTVAFGDDLAAVYNGVVANPVVTVFASVDQILDLSQLKLKARGLLPVGFLSKRGLRVLYQIARRDLVVKGLLAHPIATLRVLSLVSVQS